MSILMNSHIASHKIYICKLADCHHVDHVTSCVIKAISSIGMINNAKRGNDKCHPGNDAMNK